MSIEYTVYVNIEASDESKLNTSEDDCWHPSDEKDLGVFDSLDEAENFVAKLPMKVQDGN